MAAGWARQATQLATLSRITAVGGAPQPAFLLHRRGLAGPAADHGPPKVNFWQDPLHPARWKEEHFVIVSLAGWGAAFYGGYKYFTRGNKDKKDAKVGESSSR